MTNAASQIDEHPLPIRTLAPAIDATAVWRPLAIGGVPVGFPVVQAALSGYSDGPMRIVARRLGAPYTVAEVKIDRFLLDGIDLREYDVDDLRREIGVIFQDYMRYELVVKENIGFGKIEHLDRDAAIETAARKSLAAGVIAKLPAGFDQMIGRRFEGGVDLSGGEWQKLALARAYLRDAQLLILDEPTAALDARSEYQVFQRFAELTAGKMALFISHRFSTVRMADRIVVLENGSIAEEGTHEQLTRMGGRYAEMFELQAASYR